MRYFRINITILSLLLSNLLFSNHIFAQNSNCKTLSKAEIEKIVKDLENHSYSIAEFSDCQNQSYELFTRLIDIDHRDFKYADKRIRGDITFIRNFVRKYPDILLGITSNLKNDPVFFRSIAKLTDEALKYAGDELLNNRAFMKEMVDLNPQNFIYASQRLQNDREFTIYAIKKDGKLLKHAPKYMRDDKTIVTHAIKSNILASVYPSFRLQNDRDIKELIKSHDNAFLFYVEKYLRKYYGGIETGALGSNGYRIINPAKILDEKPLADRDHFYKWRYWDDKRQNNAQLYSGRIKQLSWKSDLQNYPDLIKQIERHLRKNLDQATIDGMTMISLWSVDDDPDLVVFKMQSLRNVKNAYNKSSIKNTSHIVGIAYNQSEEIKRFYDLKKLQEKQMQLAKEAKKKKEEAKKKAEEAKKKAEEAKKKAEESKKKELQAKNEKDKETKDDLKEEEVKESKPKKRKGLIDLIISKDDEEKKEIEILSFEELENSDKFEDQSQLANQEQENSNVASAKQDNSTEVEAQKDSPVKTAQNNEQKIEEKGAIGSLIDKIKSITSTGKEKVKEVKEIGEKIKEKIKPKKKEIEKRDWVITIVDSDLDIDTQNNLMLKNSQKEYDFWDIYINKGDRISNLIFRVSDKNTEYFEIFSKQEDHKYKSIFRGGGYSFK